MRPPVRSGLAALMVAGLVPMIAAAQQNPSPKSPQGGAAPKAGADKAATRPAPPALTPAQKAKLEEALATVNGEKITRREFLSFISQYQIAPGSEQTAYSTGLDILINTRLLTQFLNQARVTVEPAKIDAVIEENRKAAAENGTSLEAALADSNTTIEQMRESIKNTLQWRAFIEKTAQESTLKSYMEANKDVFNGAQVKASHIQVNLEPAATAADKAKAKEKLLAIKREIESGKISFADAANKYSEDPANKEQPNGGDLRWFPRKKFTETFAVAAFSLPKGKISDPVETEYGMHLIQVVDRKDGGPVQFDRYKEKVLNQFAVDEQNRIVQEMRKKAKVDIKPMPADLFGPAPAATKGATPKVQ